MFVTSIHSTIQSLQTGEIPYCGIVSQQFGKIVGSSGLFQEILFDLESSLNFSVNLSVSKDGQFGGLKEDGKTWNGLVNMENEADLVTAGLTQTVDRNEERGLEEENITSQTQFDTWRQIEIILKASNGEILHPIEIKKTIFFWQRKLR